MRLGLGVGYSGSRVSLDLPLIREADRLGFHVVWTAEAYGSDAVTPLAYIAAQTERIHLGSGIMQIPARTPAMTAMTATTLDQLSGGRMLLGLGVSGPQVVEGWHGVAYGKPLVRTREYVEIVRAICISYLCDAPWMRPSTLKPVLAHLGIGELLALHRADAEAWGRSVEHVEFCERKLREWSPAELEPPPLITGDDLREMGIKQGPIYKRLLDAVRAAQLDGVVTTKKQAIELVKRLLNEWGQSADGGPPV